MLRASHSWVLAGRAAAGAAASGRALGRALPSRACCGPRPPDAAAAGPGARPATQVGHNALGAGQLIDQGASLVDNALRTGSMFSGEGWQVGAECCLLGLVW